MIQLVLLQPTAGETPGFLEAAPDGLQCTSLHETQLADLSPGDVQVLLIPGHIDQRLLATQQAWIQAFLAQHGILVFNGLLAYPFLAALQPFQPLPERNRAALQVQVVQDHPIYQDVKDDDLTYRRGVAGFYGRGMNPPPEGAQTLVTVGQQMPLDWLWHPPGGGTLLMHAGNDIWMHHKDNTSAARLAPQLLHWCYQEAQRHAA